MLLKVLKKSKIQNMIKFLWILTMISICIDLAAKNMKGLKRILKPNGGVITAQVGCQLKKTKTGKWIG